MGDDKSKRALKPIAGGSGDTSTHNLVPRVRWGRLEDNTKDFSKTIWENVDQNRLDQSKDHYRDFQNTVRKKKSIQNEKRNVANIFSARQNIRF